MTCQVDLVDGAIAIDIQCGCTSSSAMLPIPSTPDFHKNLQTVKNGQEPCAICGRSVDVKNKEPHYVRTAYGSDLCTEEEAREAGGDAWDMPVGPDCWKKHPEIHPYGC